MNIEKRGGGKVGLTYELDLGNRKIIIELVRTKNFCRYCETLNYECLRRHRAGTVWFMSASVDSTKRYYIIADGEIPPDVKYKEIDYVREHYTTGGGWIVPKAITEINEQEFGEYVKRIGQEPNEYDLRCLMHRLLGKYRKPEAPVTPPRLLILTILSDLGVDYRDITKPELYWLRKVYRMWMDCSVKYYGDMDIKIARIPRTFTEKARFLKFGVELDYLQKYHTVVEERIVRNTKIYEIYTYEHDKYVRKLIAVLAIDGYRTILYYNDGQWKGRERYMFHNHPECIIHPDTMRYLTDKMILNRIGDVLFLDDDCIPEKVRNKLRPATKEQLKKLTTVNAKIEEAKEENTKILKLIPENRDFAIQITHPEHGTIELSPRIYTVYRVPYIEAGHD